jgi:hypothetical protein
MDGTRISVERTLTSLWSRVLQRADFDTNDNFFDVGGSSLMLVELHREIVDTLCDRIELIDMVTHPSIKTLAELIVGRTGNAFGPDQCTAQQ